MQLFGCTQQTLVWSQALDLLMSFPPPHKSAMAHVFDIKTVIAVAIALLFSIFAQSLWIDILSVVLVEHMM